MDGLDVFKGYVHFCEWVAEDEEVIRRREAAATGGVQKLSDGERGKRPTGDDGIRLLDYVSNMDALKKRRARDIASREAYRNCAIYLAEQLPVNLGGVMVRAYIEGQANKVIGEDMGYSAAHVRRLKREAEALCRSIKIISWDRVHVPVLAFPKG